MILIAQKWYSKLLRLGDSCSVPRPLFSLVFCADDVVYLVAGPQWVKAADILRLLAPVGTLYAAYATT